MADIRMEDDPRFHTLLERQTAEVERIAQACKVLESLAVSFERPNPNWLGRTPTPEIVHDWFAGDGLRSEYFMLFVALPDRNHPRQPPAFRRAPALRNLAHSQFFFGRGPIDRTAGPYGSSWMEAVRCLLLYHGGLHIFLCERCREKYVFVLTQRTWERDTNAERLNR